MRILHINKFLDLGLAAAGGAGAYVRRLMEVQARRGHEVRLFGCASGASEPGMPEYFDFAAARSPLALPRMIDDSLAAAKLDAFLRAGPADVAHVHNIYHHLTPAILPVLARRRVGVVMTVHDYRLACPAKHFLRPDGICTRCQPNKYYHAVSPGCLGLRGAAVALESFVQRLFRRYFRWVDRFCFPSRFLHGVMLQAGLPRSKAVVSRYVVDEVSLPRDTEPQPREILYAGRLSAEKNPQMMLDLAERMGDVRVVIAGDGPMGETLRRDMDQRGLGNVEMTGQVPHPRLWELYARAAAVVVPSLCLENSPLTMLEAMSGGKCVIVSDHPPLREWVRDGQTGRVFDPKDISSLQRVVEQALRDPDGGRTMGGAASALVKQRCNEQAVADQVQDLYEEAIARCGLRW